MGHVPRKIRSSRVKAQLTQLQAIQAEKEAVKSAAEAREAEAVARFNHANRAASQESQDEAGVRAHEAAEAAFAHLDSDGDGRLTYATYTSSIQCLEGGRRLAGDLLLPSPVREPRHFD